MFKHYIEIPCDRTQKSSVSDRGAPLGAREAVSGAPPSGASGYSIIEAANLADAVDLTKGHPHLAIGGAIEVIETLPIPT
jgi:hypothetical protein